jgi:tRNA(Arg) A34 adenosine deaminase TadA
MDLAIQEAYEGIKHGDGGPFGAVIVKDGKVIGKGHNCVVRNNDPTCHGEMEAIRAASKALKTFDLSGCEIYTTGQPCPMCLGALLWAHIDKIYYGCDYTDTKNIGFSDEEFNDRIKKEYQGEYLTQVSHDECLKLYSDYQKTNKKTHY